MQMSLGFTFKKSHEVPIDITPNQHVKRRIVIFSTMKRSAAYVNENKVTALWLAFGILLFVALCISIPIGYVNFHKSTP